MWRALTGIYAMTTLLVLLATIDTLRKRWISSNPEHLAACIDNGFSDEAMEDLALAVGRTPLEKRARAVPQMLFREASEIARAKCGVSIGAIYGNEVQTAVILHAADRLGRRVDEHREK